MQLKNEPEFLSGQVCSAFGLFMPPEAKASGYPTTGSPINGAAVIIQVLNEPAEAVFEMIAEKSQVGRSSATPLRNTIVVGAHGNAPR